MAYVGPLARRRKEFIHNKRPANEPDHYANSKEHHNYTASSNGVDNSANEADYFCHDQMMLVILIIKKMKITPLKFIAMATETTTTLMAMMMIAMVMKIRLVSDED